MKLVVKIENGVCALMLNRGEVHNAFDEELIALLIAALDDAATTDEIKIVVLCAEGKSFSAGADLNWMRKMADYSEQENITDAMQLGELMAKLYHFSKPTIALVQGAAIGGGVGLVACCDIAIASDNAFFAFSETKLGLTPSVISPYVIASIGARMAKKLFLTAETFAADKALEMGLIHDITSPEELATRCDFYCDNILKNGPQALTECKVLVENIQYHKIDEALTAYTAKHISARRVSEEGQQRIQAFLDKKSL